MKKPLLLQIIAFVTLATSLTWAQPTSYSPDLDAIAPKAVPNIAPPAALPDAPLPEITASKEVIIKELQRLVFTSNPGAKDLSGNEYKVEVTLEDVRPPNSLKFRMIVSQYIGEPAPCRPS